MRCLIVEDDPDIQTDLRRALEASGFTIAPHSRILRQ